MKMRANSGLLHPVDCHGYGPHGGDVGRAEVSACQRLVMTSIAAAATIVRNSSAGDLPRAMQFSVAF